MALLSWRMRFEGLPKKGRLRLQRFPVGQAELKALGSVCLVPNKRRNWYIALKVELVSGGDGMCVCGNTHAARGRVNQVQRPDPGLQSLKLEPAGFKACLH